MTEINTSKTHLPIDIPSALERIGGDESFLFDLVNIYVEDFIAKYEKLRKAVKEEDFETIKDVGHNLKGSSANLSLPLLQEISYQIETAGRDRDLDKSRKQLMLLEQEFQRLRNFLRNKG
jgi:HPt (histidine-containing phosphotransfer) domain-containing protein